MSFEGRCLLCGVEGTFEEGERPAQGSHRCPTCGAPARYQVHAQALLAMYASKARSVAGLVREEAFAALDIYEPGRRGPFRRYLRRLPGYVESGYGDDAADGIRSEDLMALSFPDESFDLVLTSHVFEHIRHPFAAFAEVHRVLRPGGAHVFTIPGRLPLPATTVARVDVSGPEDVHTLKPVFHNDLHLVYNDFGTDLLDRLSMMGFATEIVSSSVPDPIAATVVAYRSVKRPSLVEHRSRRRPSIVSQVGDILRSRWRRWHDPSTAGRPSPPTDAPVRSPDLRSVPRCEPGHHARDGLAREVRATAVRASLRRHVDRTAPAHRRPDGPG